MPGKSKKNSKNDKSSDDTDMIKPKETEESLELKRREEERQRQWDEAWEKKIREEERLEDCKACCAPQQFFSKPRIQTNIWIQMSLEKNAQHVQMAFQNLPISKPKPPPLPKLKSVEPPDSDEAPKPDKKGLKKGSKKNKK